MDVKDGLWDHLVCYGFITQKNEKILSGFKELDDQIERASKKKVTYETECFYTKA